MRTCIFVLLKVFNELQGYCFTYSLVFFLVIMYSVWYWYFLYNKKNFYFFFIKYLLLVYINYWNKFFFFFWFNNFLLRNIRKIHKMGLIENFYFNFQYLKFWCVWCFIIILKIKLSLSNAFLLLWLWKDITVKATCII